MKQKSLQDLVKESPGRELPQHTEINLSEVEDYATHILKIAKSVIEDNQI